MWNAEKHQAKLAFLTDIFKDAGQEFHKGLAQLFTQCIQKEKVLQNFCEGIVILLYKKNKEIIKTLATIAISH